MHHTVSTKPQGMQTGVNMVSKDHPVDKIKIDMTPLANAPNDPYSHMSQTQKDNVNKDASMHFHIPKLSSYPSNNRFFKDRYVSLTSQHLLRGMPRSQPYDWIDYQWNQNPPELHDTCRTGASVRWGPLKTGQKTVGHTAYGEKVDSFMNIDMYRRPPTNMPGMVVMDCGRPGEGYPLCRQPTTQTWFGSTHKLNQTTILRDIARKSRAEYESEKDYQRYETLRGSHGPHCSEYTDRYLMATKTEPRITNLEQRKRHAASAMADVSV